MTGRAGLLASEGFVRAVVNPSFDAQASELFLPLIDAHRGVRVDLVNNLGHTLVVAL